jgi:redox-sensitive bicupin YhaK (pirin superfamily)
MTRRELLVWLGGLSMTACTQKVENMRDSTINEVSMSPLRGIVSRTKGQRHGFIRRMVSPGDLGEQIKPFVFLDHVQGSVQPGTGFGWHPHSGIATLSYSLNGDVAYEDTTGQKGIIEATGLEWMRAGRGTWHQGFLYPREAEVTAFQLWLALPPTLEGAPSEGLYLSPAEVPQLGNVRVLLGSYEGHSNPIPLPSPVLYLDVSLQTGEIWQYTPPAGATVAWAFVYRGTARVSAETVSDELVIFAEGESRIVMQALAPTRFLFGCAQKHQHALVLGSHSVHSSEEALRQGVAHIREVAAELRARRVLG